MTENVLPDSRLYQKNEFGSRHAPTLAALETHTQQQHPALNMNKGPLPGHTQIKINHILFFNIQGENPGLQGLN